MRNKELEQRIQDLNGQLEAAKKKNEEGGQAMLEQITLLDEQREATCIRNEELEQRILGLNGQLKGEKTKNGEDNKALLEQNEGLKSSCIS